MEKDSNYAFIDATNLYLGIKKLGWSLDYRRFREYLKSEYSIEKAYLFIGFVSTNENLYRSLQESGFILILKPTIRDKNNEVKGNCDADLVLHTMINFNKYNKAVIISGDGDFYSLIRFLYKNNKLLRVIVPNKEESSFLLRKESKEKVSFIDSLRKKLEYIKEKRPLN